MAQTKIKAGLFEGIIGNGADGYFLMSNGDGTMTWSSVIINPTIASIAYPGSVTAADPAGGETITVTGTGFKTGANVTIGGTAAPAVSYVSETQITFTTPAKAAGDYDIVVTNTDTGSATYINGISYNGIPSWTTAAGSLGTFASGETISTITLQATEPDAGTITFNITSGALPTGLSLTGADIDGTTSLETADTLYTFTVTATDDESQATPRTFTITVKKEFKSLENFTINTYTGNGSTQSIEGKIGTAASFNGSNSYVNLPALGLGGNATRSISAWVNPATTPSSLGTVYHSGGSNAKESFNIYYQSDNKIRVEYDNRSIATTTTISNNTWTHIVATYNGGAIESSANTNIYINGVLQTVTNSGGATGVANTLNADYAIGYRRYANSLYFDGKIDQVRIFDKALSSSEVTTLYGESNTSTTKSTTDIFDDGSGVALYEFENGAKDTGGVNGYIGGAAVFNGSSSGILISTPPVQQQALSVSVWFKTTDTNLYKNIYRFDTNPSVPPTSSTLLMNTQSNGQISVAMAYGQSYKFNFNHSATGLNDGQWHHAVFSWDGTTNSNAVKFYVDNVVTEGTSTGAASSMDVYDRLYIGRSINGSYFNGSIDDVRVYSDALTSQEVGYLYNNTTASIPTDYAAYYKLDGDATDETGNYDGTPTDVSWGYDGTPTNVSFVGTSFEPDLVWIKNRFGYGHNHNLIDSVRGAGSKIFSNLTNAEATTGGLASFDSNGFSFNSSSGNDINEVNFDFVAWCWKAASSDSTNTDGSITSTVRANQDAGFSIVKYTGNGTTNQTIGHGLSSSPTLIITKCLNDGTKWWGVNSTLLTTNTLLRLDSTSAGISDSGNYITMGNSSTFTVQDGSIVNGSLNYIAYCFHSVDSYQKIGTYTGTGASGQTITTGFQPRFVMIKATNNASDWYMIDAVRPNNKFLIANGAGSEYTASDTHTFTSTGFTLSGGSYNNSGYDWVYLAIA